MLQLVGLQHSDHLPRRIGQFAPGRSRGSRLRIVSEHFKDPVLIRGAALTSIIQNIWDHLWTDTRIKLVLDGAHLTAMRRLEEADQPLYGRRTGRLLFPPFGPNDVGAFVPSYAARDQLLTFGIFGGLPGHLALLDDATTLRENALRLMIDPAGRLFDEAQHMLDAFMSDADVHYSIVAAIANGERTWSRITSRLGKSSGSLSRPVRWLEAMEVIARVVPITEASPRTSKRAIYRLSDPYVAFWHRFIAPLIATGDVNNARPEELWRERINPQLDDYMGPPFEDMCRAWIARGAEHKRLPFIPDRVGGWWDANSQSEVDVVAIGSDGQMLVGECKWGAVNDDDLTMLRRRAELIVGELGGKYTVNKAHYAVFSSRGSWSKRVAAAIADGSVLGFTADDIVAG